MAQHKRDRRRDGRSGRWSRGVILPVMGVLTVVAVAVGLHLGESAVGQIDPLYYRGAAPVAQDVSAQQRPALRSAYAEASGWEAGQLAMARDCGADCPPFHARDAGTAPSSLGIGDVAAPPSAPRVDAPPAFPEEPIATADSGAPARTNRYLHYPVSHEPEPPAPSFAPPEPTPAKPGMGRGDPEGM